MSFSKRASGILLALALPLIVQFGFSDSCANEVIAKVAPILSALPGLALSWFGSMKAEGPMTVGGFSKKG
jgi:hypothetical protein